MPILTVAEARWSVLLDAGTAGAVPPAAAVAVLGGKGAQTAKLVASGLPVPPTGVVTVEAYRSVAADPLVARMVARIRQGEDVAADEVDAVFQAATLPADVAAGIVRLASSVAGGGRMAIRSSATVEDLGGTSFAGQYRSFLDVAPGRAVLEAVRLVWASLWHPADGLKDGTTG